MTMAEITPFDPSIRQAEVDRLRRKLEDTHLPAEPIVPDAGEEYGWNIIFSATVSH